MSPTLQGRVRLSRLPGICMAFALSSVAFAGIDCGSEANCQLPTQTGHGPSGVVAATSDFAAGFTVAENFAIDAGGTITDLCWWGTYTDFVVPCPDGDVADNFTITFLTNNPGCPTGAPDAILAGPFAVAVTKMATGNVIPSGLGDLVEYQYTATIPGGVIVGAGQCVWLEIQNDTTGGVCLWLWETAEGDGGAFQAGAATDYDLAFCLNLPLGDTSACVLPINPACEGAKGPCGGPNGSPGCEDACCCTLVCDPAMGGDPSCCLFEWDEQCANRALDLGCATPPPCQPEPNCQVFDTTVAFNSTGGDLFVSADDFTPLANGNITDICWYGVYSGDAPTDDFTVRYYDDANGLPGAVIAEFSQAQLIGFTREDSGEAFPPFVYSATHDPVPVEGGACYWIEISNPNDDSVSWFWDTAGPAEGNGRIALDGIVPDGYDTGDLLAHDLAFCLGLELSPPACGFVTDTLFNTGPEDVVLFNGSPTFLGWSSGNLCIPNCPGDEFPQRRVAQAFTLPTLPPGLTAWQINHIAVDGFTPAGLVNDFLNFEIFTRTAFDVPPTAPDSVAFGSRPFPFAVENPEGGFGGAASMHVMISPDVTLPPGDYWLTVYASNVDGAAVASNFAWFTNAPDGINNFCTLNTPPPTPEDQANPSVVGCDGTGDTKGNPFTYRARRWPSPPEFGFGSYSLIPSVLDVDPVNDPDPDPNDLYNAAFQIRGQPGTGGPPCPADFDLSGAVDVKDLLFLLGAWGPCPKQGDCPADFDDSNAVDVKDLLFLLGAWGPCP